MYQFIIDNEILSWLFICFRSTEEDHIRVPSCRSGHHQDSIQHCRHFRTFNKYVWWEDRILALWILHIFFEHLKKTSNKFSSNLTRNSISNFVLPQTGIMMQDHWMKIRTSHDCSLYLLPLNKFSRKISHKLNIIRLQYYLCFPLLYNSL